MNGNQPTPRKDVYDALYKASEQIGANNFRRQMNAWLKKGRRRHTFKFAVSDIHDEITEAMPKVMKGIITIDEGMALLHTPEAMNERFKGGDEDGHNTDKAWI